MARLSRSLVDALNIGAPAWLVEQRLAGLAAFDRLPMPNPKDEVWRYVELDFDLTQADLPEISGQPLPSGQIDAALMPRAGGAMIVDGFLISHEGSLPKGSWWGSASAAPDSLHPRLGKGIQIDLDKFSAAHHAFFRDGLALCLGRNQALAEPLLVEVQATAGISFPRVTVVLESNAEVSLVVNYRSADGTQAMVVPQLEAWVGDGARLRLTTVQQWGNATRAICQQRIVAGAGASVHWADAGMGGKFSRTHFFLDLDGAGADGRIDGVYFGDGEQVLDYRGFVDHSAPHTTSNMFLKGGVEQSAHSIFTGLIRIEESAQQSNAYQINRNLVLSEGAGAESVPNLEILANDVKCGHGSSVGPLDEEIRYYLMSRGLDRARADRLAVRGFFEEAITRFPHPGLAEPLRDIVQRKYQAAQEAEAI